MPPLKPLIIAHRGASSYLPENTLESFRLAVDIYKVDMIEFDLHATQDGVPVVFHDARLNRITDGEGFLSQKTFRELQSLDAGYRFDPDGKKQFPKRGQGFKIPAFEELLRAFPQLPLAVEIKENSAEFTHSVMNLIRQFGRVNHVTVGAKHAIVSETMRKHYSEVRRFCSRDDVFKLLIEFHKRKRPETKDPMTVASIPMRSFGIRFDTEAWIDFLHAKGMRVYFWTVISEEEMRDLTAKGADGLIVNDPALANQVLGRPGGTAPTSV